MNGRKVLVFHRSAANAWCGRLARLPYKQAGDFPTRWDLGELTTGLSAVSIGGQALYF